MLLIEHLKGKAYASPQRIVLCEGEDERVLVAAHRIANEQLAQILIVGNPRIIKQKSAAANIGLDHLKLIDPNTSPWAPAFAQEIYTLRQHRGMTFERASTLALDPLVFSFMMTRNCYADGAVAGATHTTADVVRYAIQLVGMAENSDVVSSYSIMMREAPFFENNHVLIYADTSLVVDPDASLLAKIAIATADNTHRLLAITPRIALLSFSTHGSGQHLLTEKVQHAVAILRSLRPDLLVDGELQLDAAISPEIASRKAPNSSLRGTANVLIFPNLDAANIAHKITERLAGASAIGPLIQGLQKPINDLSRGCSVDDIYHVILYTSVQAAACN